MSTARGPAVSSEEPKGRAPGRAAVLGSPVRHSLSPTLHLAAYQALELRKWTYERIECDERALPGLVAGLGADWVGLSVTMPGKRAALRVADEVTERASAVGAANTLTRIGPDRWRADSTDVAGVVGALRAAAGLSGGVGRSAVVLGAGGTAAAALAGLAELRVPDVCLVVRDPARAGDTLAAAGRLGLPVRVARWSEVDFGALAGAADVLVSTVPAGVADGLADRLAASPCVLDVVYHPWPTPLADAVVARGGRIATGLDMLLHQAFGQVEQFTGRPAPRAAMRDALRAATGGDQELPL